MVDLQKVEPKDINGKRGANAESKRSGNKLLMLTALLVTLLIVAFTVWWYLIRVPDDVVLKVGAGPYRSDSYELMKEVAEVVERHGTGVKIKVVATTDSSQNISKLNRGEIDMATIRSDTPVVDNVRLIASLFPDYFQFIARTGAGIRYLTELKGKRIAIPPYGTDEFRSFWVVADHYDLAIKSMKWQPMPLEEAKDKLLKGEVDVLFTVRSLRDRLLLNLFEDATITNVGLYFLEVDQAEAIALKRPFVQVANVPRGAFIGARPTPRREVKTAIVNRVLVTREDIDPAAIAEVTRVLFEHRLDLIIRFALASAIVKSQEGQGVSSPLHEGAERYFNRDAPSFIQENAEPIALIITILAMLFSGLLTLRSRMGNTQKDRMDSYNYMLLDIADKARVTEKAGEIKSMKEELFKILETVVRALDTDEVTEEGFQSFSLLWKSVSDVLNDRAREVA